MSATFKGSCTSNGGIACNANTAVTWTGGLPAATDSIVVFVYCTTAVNDFTSVTDSAGNTYTQDYNYLDGASAGHAVYRATNISGSPTWIRIGKTSTSNICFVASAYAGMASGAIESATQYTEGAGTPTHSIPYTTTNNNDTVLMLYHGGVENNTPTNLGSWGWINGDRNATDMFYLLDAGAAGSYNFTYTAPFYAASMVRAVYRAAVTDPTVSTVSNESTVEGGTNTHTVTLSGPTNRAGTPYSIALAGVTATGGGVDFTSALASLTFGSSGVTFDGTQLLVPNAVTTFPIVVATVDDLLDEASETYTLTVGGTAGTGTITDNDAPPVVTFSDGVESFGVVTCVATLGAVSGKDVTFDVSTANGSKTAGTHYTAIVAQTVTIPAGSLTAAITVNTL